MLKKTSSVKSKLQMSRYIMELSDKCFQYSMASYACRVRMCWARRFVKMSEDLLKLDCN